MKPSRRDIVIATRRSQLALAQSQWIARWLAVLNPRVGVRLVPLESEADAVTDRPLAALGGKGLFTRAIEQALLDGRADIAVHSLKDLPTEPTRGLTLAAIPKRMPAHDVLIARGAASITDLPPRATLGTSSPRRAAQVRRARPDINIMMMRGNVDTRLRKVLDEHRYDATLLAAAGLMRLGLDEHARHAVCVEQVLPAAGQGALAVQCRGDDHATLRRLIPLNDPAASATANAERHVVAGLRADCHSPVGVLAEMTAHDVIRIRARVLSIDGAVCHEADESGQAKRIGRVCDAVVNALVEQGAKRTLAEAARAMA